VDIGGDHVLVIVTPDGKDQPTGADVEHLTPGGERCIGWILFDVPANTEWPAARKWQVESWDPLTLSPSLACGCGDHGFVRDSSWVRA
jgi:hypothetical protein